jgi:ubiquinone biosynthesis protein COQ4|tara:strand:- start:273 stop:1001 length:729 start_codon:yes stop_codon:yes gene_type:complete
VFKLTNRIQPRVAFKAIKALIQDPDQTEQVFIFVDAMAGDATEKCTRRLESTAAGQRIFATNATLLDTLVQREKLEAMAEGSLGRAYLDFLDSGNLTPDGLLDASDSADMSVSADKNTQRLAIRLRDQHDLWHVTTDYRRDVAGEASLLAFTYAQTKNRGLGLISIIGGLKLAKHYGFSIFKSLWEGYRLGKRAAWLPQQEWETLLLLPLDQVRDILNIGRPLVYAQLSATAEESHIEEVAA